MIFVGMFVQGKGYVNGDIGVNGVNGSRDNQW